MKLLNRGACTHLVSTPAGTATFIAGAHAFPELGGIGAPEYGIFPACVAPILSSDSQNKGAHKHSCVVKCVAYICGPSKCYLAYAAMSVVRLTHTLPSRQFEFSLDIDRCVSDQVSDPVV